MYIVMPADVGSNLVSVYADCGDVDLAIGANRTIECSIVQQPIAGTRILEQCPDGVVGHLHFHNYIGGNIVFLRQGLLYCSIATMEKVLDGKNYL